MHHKTAAKRRPAPPRRAGTRGSEDVPWARAEPLLTVRQAARMLYVSRPTVYSMIRRGELRVLYVRWMVRLRMKDVETYMRLHRKWVLRQRLKQMRAKAERSD